MPDEIEDINDKYEAKHLAHLKKVEREIRLLYESAINEIVVAFSSITYNGKVFRLRDYPALNARINKMVDKLHASIYTTVVNSLIDSWELANEKNNVFVDKRLAGKVPSKKAKQILFDSNLGALNQFIKRKEKGLNLSTRVWNSLDGFKTEMETALGVGISEGKSGRAMATDLKRYLKEPDRLYRRVRNDKGELKLSKAAKEYKPGQGVYRSSFLNAKRLTVTETNMSYRTADFERWQQLPFVIGIQVKLSNNHPKYDICDELKGTYPKDFHFRGWHPFCRCFAVAVQMSDKEYSKYEDAILASKELDFKPSKTVSAPPKSFVKYLDKNRERINGWANTPYWLSDNTKYTAEK